MSYSMAILYLQIALVWEGFCFETEWAKYNSLFITGNKIIWDSKMFVFWEGKQVLLHLK